jgi:hypothetical protein
MLMKRAKRIGMIRKTRKMAIAGSMNRYAARASVRFFCYIEPEPAALASFGLRVKTVISQAPNLVNVKALLFDEQGVTAAAATPQTISSISA